MLLTAAILFCFGVTFVDAHGYLFEPVARSSAWLVDPSFKPCCTYEGHMEMFCGGVGHQWNSNGGKCGICGEPYDRAVKLFEKGGRMYTGRIVQIYNQAQEIDVKVKLSANHLGYFEFRVCSVDMSPETDATQECLDQYLLTIVETNSTRFQDLVRFGSEMITIRARLPAGVACEHCVFQWKYTTGNNWGKDPTTNKSGPGLGRENETFMGCADITILPIKPPPTPPPIVIKPKTTRTRKITATTLLTMHWWLSFTTLSSSSSSAPSAPSPSPPTTTTIAKELATTTTTMMLQTTRTTAFTETTSILPISMRRAVAPSMWSGLLHRYERGEVVIYNGMRYRCMTTHHSYAGAEPSPLTWALWRKID